MEKHFFPADVLLPKKDFRFFAVIACDQYTSEPEYWEQTAKEIGDNPSALKLILPEVYLKPDNSEKIAEINANMQKYLESDLFKLYPDTYVLTVRTLKNGKQRKGIVGLIDLEDYSYEKGAKTSIRATEQTVVERIPPRVEIRREAPLEIPHVMLLINDKNETVIEPLAAKKDSFQKLYDFELLQQAGKIEGYRVSGTAADEINKALAVLKNESNSGFLFAVGDGNHSLACAKECYKTVGGSRYAMVEVVNIYDPSLEFEPIYRVLFGVEPEQVIDEFVKYMGGECKSEKSHEYICVYGDIEKSIRLKAAAKLAVADLQNFLDKYIEKHPSVKIDYIHGKENLRKLCKDKNTLGFLFDGMSKEDLFPAVEADGSLPRKTFSMGCADDKRFYLEARKIK
ncbi:MAG: DUF1015 domain-containing protein [Acutalibacteraceae bacterium]|jgi:hypothetical protein